MVSKFDWNGPKNISSYVIRYDSMNLLHKGAAAVIGKRKNWLIRIPIIFPISWYNSATASQNSQENNKL